MSYTGAVVVVPTRNRARLAGNAIRSVLGQAGGGVQVLVSDNSTDAEEVAELSRFCEQLGDPRLDYVRPPRPLSMTEHWEWAIREALRREWASHFLYVTDRMIFKQGELEKVLGFAAAYPDRIISYFHDRVDDHARPFRVERYAGTGRLLEIGMENLARLYARGGMHGCIPRMLNCVAPRSALELLAARFGSVFDSVAPDYNFGFRCVAAFDSFIYYDAAPIFHYALDRSNGASFSRGELTRDAADFLANLPDADGRMHRAAPIPEITTPGNTIFNEYYVVKNETGSPRFREVERERYLEVLAWEVGQYADPQQRAAARAVLAAHGWAGGAENGAAVRAGGLALARKLVSPRAVARKLQQLSAGAKAAPLWRVLSRRFGVAPPAGLVFEFDSFAEAAKFLNEPAPPPRRAADGARVLELLAARELSAPDPARD